MREVTLKPVMPYSTRKRTHVNVGEIIFHDSNTGDPWKRDQAIRKFVWTPALKRPGLKYRNPYKTRHTFASILLSRGENQLWVAQQMGHKDWGMIRKTYGRWINQQVPSSK
jgi:integrase